MNSIIALGMEARAAGALVEEGDLMPIEQGATVQLAVEAITVLDSPHTEAKEWVGGYAATK